MNKQLAIRVGVCAALLTFAYVAISGIRYRFAHPELTEVQCILNLGDLITWK